jgi:hypothetical protein
MEVANSQRSVPCGLIDPEGFENAHRAIHDANATLKVLRKLEGMNAEFRSAS